MEEMIRQHHARVRCDKDTALVAKTLVMQEAITIGIQSRIEWCEKNDVNISGLLPDGIYISNIPIGTEIEDIETQSSSSASSACGYQIKGQLFKCASKDVMIAD